MIFRGTTIDELIESVQRAEQNAGHRDAMVRTVPLLPVYNDEAYTASEAYSREWLARDWHEVIEVA